MPCAVEDEAPPPPPPAEVGRGGQLDSLGSGARRRSR
uniref:Uncharacterized protein n=1 Tax=Arundo donax TaxID=35708 RepID=A0A0A9AYD0_ARUDO